VVLPLNWATFKLLLCVDFFYCWGFVFDCIWHKSLYCNILL